MALQTVSALSASNMSFTGYEIADLKSFHTCSGFYNLSYIFMACRQSDGDGMLRPVIPLIDVNVRTADGRLMYLNLYVIGTNLRNRHPFHPQAFLRFLFDQRPHHTIIFFTHCLCYLPFPPSPQTILLLMLSLYHSSTTCTMDFIHFLSDLSKYSHTKILFMSTFTIFIFTNPKKLFIITCILSICHMSQII